MADVTHEQADNALADALWWFRGHSAARPMDERDQTYDLGEKLLNVRNWLKDLATGDRRMIGLHERHLGIVLTEGEFETVFDALRYPTDTPTPEREQIVAKMRRAYDRFATERSALNADPEIPF